jgi:uncharacterized protein (DUF427 family)
LDTNKVNIRHKPIITLEPVGERVRATVRGEVIADSANVIRLHEVGREPVFYFPIKDVKKGALAPTDRSTHCPLKGDANYYSLQLAGGRRIDNAVWQYSHPYPGVLELADRVAFYAHFVDDFQIGD